MKKKFPLLLVLIMVLFCTPVMAAALPAGPSMEAASSSSTAKTTNTGWRRSGSHWRYYIKGKRQKNCVLKIGNYRYGFDKHGNLLKGFFTVNGSSYYASSKTGPNKTIKYGRILSGYRRIGKDYYYFDPANNCRMLRGLAYVGGRLMYFSTKTGKQYRKAGKLTVNGKTYTVGADGVLKPVSTTASTVTTSSKSASSKYTHMIDVSQWQGTIDFAKVKASGVKAVIIRAGYGDNHVDKYFYKNIKNAKAAGLRVGIYWFSYAYTKQMAVNEANHVCRILKPYKIDLPVYFDWEYDSMRFAKEKMKRKTFKKTNWRSQITSMTSAFCSTVTKNGFRAGYYFNLDYLTRFYDASKLKKYSTWYAYWGTNQSASNIWSRADKLKVPAAYDLWQFSSRGHIPGIKGNVDCDLLLDTSIVK